MLSIPRKLVANIQVIGQRTIMASKKKAAYQKKIKSVMGEFGRGTLHSGKGGPVVKSKKQAIAIAISSADRLKKKRKK
jgi:Family of unknown function (DUF6496)